MKIYGVAGRMNIIGERVRDKRLERDRSQSELAYALQCEGVIVEQKAISRIELGERLVTDYELLAFSRVLGVSVEWLLTGNGPSGNS